MSKRADGAKRPEKAAAWELYDRLIEGVPAGIAVRDYCLGTRWTYVEADCGMGVSFSCKGGAPYALKDDLRKADLRRVAELAKSWCFEEASLGVAALNAWYSRPEMIDGLGALYDDPVELPDGTTRKLDAFGAWRPRIEEAHPDGDARVVVVGHFPHVDRIEEYAQLTVLERSRTSPLDTPDPACEYMMPLADYAFITGVTIINKTCPRLLQLAQRATTVMTGPSVVMSPVLFEYGADTLAGSVVEDPEKVSFAVKTGKGQFFGEALRMSWVSRPGC